MCIAHRTSLPNAHVPIGDTSHCNDSTSEVAVRTPTATEHSCLHKHTSDPSASTAQSSIPTHPRTIENFSPYRSSHGSQPATYLQNTVSPRRICYEQAVERPRHPHRKTIRPREFDPFQHLHLVLWSAGLSRNPQDMRDMQGFQNQAS